MSRIFWHQDIRVTHCPSRSTSFMFTQKSLCTSFRHGYVVPIHIRPAPLQLQWTRVRRKTLSLREPVCAVKAMKTALTYILMCRCNILTFGHLTEFICNSQGQQKEILCSLGTRENKVFHFWHIKWGYMLGNQLDFQGGRVPRFDRPYFFRSVTRDTR